MEAGKRGCASQAGMSIMQAILDFAQQLYRIAQGSSMGSFQALALAALAQHLRFEVGLWIIGRFHDEQLQVHRLYAYGLPHVALEDLVALLRQSPITLGVTAAALGCAQVFDAAQLYARTGGEETLALVHRLGMERQLLVAGPCGGGTAMEWLSLYRPQSGMPFGEGDCEVLRALMPHLSESRSVNRALCLQRASNEALLAPHPNRALTLPDGTVLHCGQHMSEAIETAWPHWGGVRVPAALLSGVLKEGGVTLAGRGEIIQGRRFSDSLVLSIRSITVSERLTRREYEIAQLYAAGRDYAAIARRLALAPTTVRNILRHCYRKLGINSRAQLARLLERAAESA